MAEDRWAACDLPILEAIARLEEGPDSHFGAHQLATESGLDLESVKQSLRRLEGEYVSFKAMPGDNDPLYSVRNIRLLGPGRRATRQWPSPENALASLVDAITEVADHEPDAEKQSKLRRAAVAVAGITGDLATNVAGAYLARISGIS